MGISSSSSSYRVDIQQPAADSLGERDSDSAPLHASKAAAGFGYFPERFWVESSTPR